LKVIKAIIIITSTPILLLWFLLYLHFVICTSTIIRSSYLP